MRIVGELINASRKKIRDDIKEKNRDVIAKVAKEQHEHGADFIDVNAGIFVGKETDYMNWLVETVQETLDTPCCIDSPDPKVVEEALKIHKGTPMINSISLESERYNAILPILKGTDAKIIALCMSDEGMPYTKEDRLKIADKLINSLVQNNVKPGNIYVDPLVHPIGSGNHLGNEFLKTIEAITEQYEGVHTICGLSNISYGIPKRQFANQVFMSMAITKGLDSAILNPMDQRMMANIVAAETLIGKDDYCMNYVEAYRNGLFDFNK
ncbi:MAG: methyltetrahydrofolate cobalamin methyltransferase [Bacteroidales bacterium]|nr:methyltetrahydrofolate cobalamin methyltransferase [Bacteroidales bacterium]